MPDVRKAVTSGRLLAHLVYHSAKLKKGRPARRSVDIAVLMIAALPVLRPQRASTHAASAIPQ